MIRVWLTSLGYYPAKCHLPSNKLERTCLVSLSATPPCILGIAPLAPLFFFAPSSINGRGSWVTTRLLLRGVRRDFMPVFLLDAASGWSFSVPSWSWNPSNATSSGLNLFPERYESWQCWITSWSRLVRESGPPVDYGMGWTEGFLVVKHKLTRNIRWRQEYESC